MNLLPAKLRSLEPLRVRRGGAAEGGAAEGGAKVEPNFTDDLSPLPAVGHSALWTYRAIYRLNDADFGQWSDAVSVSVAW